VAVKVGEKTDAGSGSQPAAPAAPKAPKVSRMERIAKIVDEGKPFTYVGERTGDFKCTLCGGKGIHAIVLKDKNGGEVLVGATCLRRTGCVKPVKQATGHPPVK